MNEPILIARYISLVYELRVRVPDELVGGEVEGEVRAAPNKRAIAV